MFVALFRYVICVIVEWVHLLSVEECDQRGRSSRTLPHSEHKGFLWRDEFSGGYKHMLIKSNIVIDGSYFDSFDVKCL